MMRKLQTREHVLLIVALFVFSALAYGSLRYRPISSKLDRYHDKLSEIQTALNKCVIPDEMLADPLRLQQRIDALDSTIALRLDRVEQLRSRFIRVDSAAAKSSLRHAISERALRCGIQIESFIPGEDSGTTHAAHHTQQDSSVAEHATLQRVAALPNIDNLQQWLAHRPHYTLIARCQFDQLRRFVDDLQNLPWTVIITNFEIETQDEPVLRVRLNLAI